MRLHAVIAAATAASIVAQIEPSIFCDPNYDCQWTHVDAFGSYYNFDFSHLCSSFGYQHLDTATNFSYAYNICGYSPQKCLPLGHGTRYVHGAAVQFMGPRPPCGANDTKCVDPTNNQTVCCTPDCEVLGVGTPLWSLVDPTNAASGGVMLRHSAVSTSDNDNHKCEWNPALGTWDNREVTFIMQCDTTVGNSSFRLIDFRENTTCKYVVTIATSAACGCAPDCSGGKLCGPDGCGGWCSGPDLAGSCPIGHTCMADYTCCRPDCTERDCGSDGCGGSCGSCGGDEVCTTAGVCMSSNPFTPTAAATYGVDHGSLAGAFFGGAASVVVLGAVAWFFLGGGKARFDAWRFAGPDGASVKQSLVSGGSTGASRSYGASSAISTMSGGYGSSSTAYAPVGTTTEL